MERLQQFSGLVIVIGRCLDKQKCNNHFRLHNPYMRKNNVPNPTLLQQTGNSGMTSSSNYEMQPEDICLKSRIRLL